MPHREPPTFEELLIMEMQLDEHFRDIHRPHRMDEIRAKLAGHQSLTVTDGLFALQHFHRSLNQDFLLSLLHPDVRFISKHFHIRGDLAVTRQFAEWYTPKEDPVRPPRSRHMVVARFVDRRIGGPVLASIGHAHDGYGCIGYQGVSVGPLDPQDPQSPHRIVTIFSSHFLDHLSGGACFANEHCSPSRRLLARATGFEVQLSPGQDKELNLRISTRSQTFETRIYQHPPWHGADSTPEHLQRWLRAIDTGVDECVMRTHHHSGITLHARAMDRGLVQLMIEPRSIDEPFELSAFVPREELIGHFQKAIDSVKTQVRHG